METFYSGRCILLTGATGFVGKVYVEKILRSFPSISKVFCLIRPRKGQTSHSRLLNEVIKSPVFDRLRRERDDFDALSHEKLQALSGDVCSENLGLSEESLSIILENVDIVVHCAATVDFIEPLQVAVEMNCLGSLNVLELAHKVKDLKTFVHVSTAYVNSSKKNWTVEEKIYPLEFDVERAFEAILSATPAGLEKLSINLMGTFPNTYTLSKAMAEHMLEKRRGSIPLVILRPSIIGASWSEPLPGWVDNVSAAGSIFLATGLGMLTILPGNPRGLADIIPVDFVVSGIIAVSAKMAGQDTTTIVHCGTSDPRANPLRWRVPMKVVVDYWRENPPKRAIATSKFSMIRSHQNYQIQWFLRYALPSSAYSTLANFVGKQSHILQASRLWKLTWRARTMTEVFKPFTESEWVFSVSNLLQIQGDLNESDRESLRLDFAEIAWERYLTNFCYGLARWVLKEDVMEVMPESVKHTELALSTGRMLEWDSDHHKISFPGLFSDISWAYTSSRKPGYTKSGLLGRFMGFTGWREGMNHEASHVSRPTPRTVAELKYMVLASERVQKAIAEAAREEDVMPDEVVDRANSILDRMSADVNYERARKMAWGLRKVLRRLYDGIKVDEQGLKMVRALAQEGRAPLVLMPTHRSYMDFLLVSYICFAYNLPIPHIAAGEDFLNLSVVSNLLRHCGAFFIRRSFKDDLLYTAIYNEYTQRLLADGNSVEFFIEGTRSRSGKQLAPKFGMLRTVLDTYWEGQIKDALLIPITIDYEKPLEASLHKKELLGQEKVKESLSSLFESSKILADKFGHISIRFGQIVAVSETVPKNIEMDRGDPQAGIRAATVRSLAFKMTSVMINTSVCMPTHLVATLVLMYRNGIAKSELIRRWEWLREEILQRGGRVECTEGVSKVLAVDRALRLLSDLVTTVRKDVYVPLTLTRESYDNLLGLGYYRNKIVHYFYEEGIVAVALQALQRRTDSEQLASKGKSKDGLVTFGSLQKEVTFLEALLEVEFVGLQTRTSERVMQKDVRRDQARLEERINALAARGIVRMGERAPKKHDPRHTLHLREAGDPLLSMLCGFVWPYIDSYFVAAISLFALRDVDAMPQKLLIDRMLWLAETMYHEGVICHYESCSMETLRNALITFQKLAIVTCGPAAKRLKSHKALPPSEETVSLSREFSQVCKLEKFSARIESFRKRPHRFNPYGGVDCGKQMMSEFPLLSRM